MREGNFNHIGSRLSTETLPPFPGGLFSASYFNHIGSRLSTETMCPGTLIFDHQQFQPHRLTVEH
mgnify:CR=1 FL=1